MKDEHQGAILAGGLGIGILVGIVLSFILKSSPLIGDCGTNVEINKFYLYVGLFATKLLFTIACAMGGFVFGLLAVGVSEGYVRAKKAIQAIGTVDRVREYSHVKYNYNYFITKTVDVITEAYFVLIAWGIGLALHILTLKMSPEICYISDKTRSDFILSTALTVSVFSLLAGSTIYTIAKKFRSQILQYLIGDLVECDNLDSVMCKCNTPDIESLFDKDIYTVELNQGRVAYTLKDGSCHTVNFMLYNWGFSPYYRVLIYNLDGKVRADDYHGYTLRQVITHTIKVCEKYQKKA